MFAHHQSATAMEHSHANQAPIEHRFNPYTDNGGTMLAIAGDDFAVIAGDTRSTSGYNINTRYQPKVFEVGDNIVVGANGFAADGETLVRRIAQRIEVSNTARNGEELSC
ncbi:hypothetical protein G7K_4745-t1 [Saitoella complicata NRRL Y-17804]|uniref:Proteasome subunit beta n=1 Tax=Saitoella complicata (strain BCRC 22490 / CBS 7301 / JCM 7358 / NBRC 10748 / NRRL Y-17804) TaxID=698492 RepID=A0A0E9NLR5_SAICN|nr:hypothetical protein G7K_4745-t1 [Saitoella complicata NRRL Y-17804]